MTRRVLRSLTMVWLLGSVAVSWLTGPPSVFAQEAPSYTIDAMGLYDAIHTRNDGVHEGRLRHTTTTGFAAGYSVRWDKDSDVGDSAWVYDSATGTSTRIGLIEPGEADRWSSIPNFLNQRGQVAGIARWNSSSVSSWGWFFDSATQTNTQIGFFDDQHTHTDGRQVTEVQALTESGHSFGNSMCYDGSTYMGRWVWAYDSNLGTTTRIGFFGTEYTSPINGEQYSAFRLANSQGFATGVSKLFPHYPGTTVAWSYDPATSAVRRVGMNDPSGNVFWPDGSDGILGITENRLVIGTFGYGGDHQAIWVHNDASNATTRAGLFDEEHTSPGGTQYATDAEWNSSGQVIGRSNRYPADDGRREGWSAWMFDPATATSTRLGFTDAEHTKVTDQEKKSWAEAINESGMVIGGSERWEVGTDNGNGRTAWLYDPSTDATTKLGNRSTIPGTGSYHHNTPAAINNRGQVVGEAQQTAGRAGNAMWMYDSASDTTRQLGFDDDLHTHPYEDYQWDGFAGITDSGLVAGSSLRLGLYPFNSSSGQTAWLYDWDSDSTTSLVFSENAEYEAFSVVDHLTDDGIVIGKYQLFEGDEDETILRTFIGSLDVGFFDFDSLVAGGLAPNGWDRLEQDIFNLGQMTSGAAGLYGFDCLAEEFRTLADDPSLLESNCFAGMGYRLDGSYVPFAVQPVPEPSSLALLVTGAMVVLLGYGWRRRKRAA